MSEQLYRYAVVRDGVVENVVLWDGESDWAPPEGSILVETAAAGPGDTYDGAKFRKSVAPPQAKPVTLEDVIAALPAEIRAKLK